MAVGGRKGMTVDSPKVKRLLEALALGDFVQEACQYAHISQATYYRWLQEGQPLQDRFDAGEELTEREEEVRVLAEALREAELKGQHAALSIIRKAAQDGTWQAAAWFLERRNKKWSNRTEITGADGGPVTTLTVDEVDEQLRQLIEETKSGQSPTAP